MQYQHGRDTSFSQIQHTGIDASAATLFAADAGYFASALGYRACALARRMRARLSVRTSSRSDRTRSVFSKSCVGTCSSCRGGAGAWTGLSVQSEHRSMPRTGSAGLQLRHLVGSSALTRERMVLVHAHVSGADWRASAPVASHISGDVRSAPPQQLQMDAQMCGLRAQALLSEPAIECNVLNGDTRLDVLADSLKVGRVLRRRVLA